MTQSRASTPSGADPQPSALGWPQYPSVVTTLLAASGIILLFVGVSLLTATRWLTWVGLGLMVLIAGIHLMRYRQAQAQRQGAQTQLKARLVSRCMSAGDNPFLERFRANDDPVVLVLNDDSLQLGHIKPLTIFSSIPLYDIQGIFLPAGPTQGGEEATKAELTISFTANNDRHYLLALKEFERHAPASKWVELLQPLAAARRNSRLLQTLQRF